MNSKSYLRKIEFRSPHRRGQMEIFGLAIIIILIALGLYLVVVLKAKEKPQNYRNDYVADKVPADFVISLTQVTIDECNGRYTLGGLLKDCATAQRITCGGYFSCDLANRTLTHILNQTFMTWGYSVVLSTNGLARGGYPEVYVSTPDCSTKNKGRQGETIIPLAPEPGEVFLRMSICK